MQTVNRNVGHDSLKSFSFQSVFTRKYDVAGASLILRTELMIFISISVDGKIEARRIRVNNDLEPYSIHSVLSFFYFMTIAH